MTTTTTDIVPKKIDHALNLAAGAWEAFCTARGLPFARPRAVVPLKPHRSGRKSGVYRLEGAGEGGSDVVAKRCDRDSASVERTVHELILPRLRVTRYHYHGFHEEPHSAFCWLFMEDAGGSKLFESDRDLAARWLAVLHASAAELADQIPLPERGQAHYREHLRAARATVAELARERSIAHADREMLLVLGDQICRLDSSWEHTCAPCRTAPRTLVHGDFGRKNVRVRTGPAGRQELVALDWETAGWGPPSADIPHSPRRAPPRKPRTGPPQWRGTVPLEVYAANAGGLWHGSAFEQLMRVSHVGSIFRSIASIRWALEQLRAGGVAKGIGKLRWYAEDLPRTLDTVNW